MVKPKPKTDINNGGANIAIIAGNGVLPIYIRDELISSGQKPILIGVDNEINPKLVKHADAVLTFGQVGKLFELLTANNVDRVIFAGGITKRPDYKKLKLDFLTIKEMPRLLKIVFGGDNSVLTKISTYFETHDIKVVGSHEIAPNLIAQNGVIAGKFSKRTAMPTIKLAVTAAKTIGAIDVGQAAIAEDGRVVALEALEGTDAMLNRVVDLRKAGRLNANPKMGILAKMIKPEQDMRADLPAIGPKTVAMAAKAGLKGIVIESGKSLILDREATVKKAESLNIFIYGYDYEASN
ncbi:MAG: UDP-2,3-diacylglucosamine diphosphatase LpxI [Rhizobiales bacterium]|nr:UDP-2,3-diacylglucosamine diphosphatase LpxI [Hyphomicrobiales bacterium]